MVASQVWVLPLLALSAALAAPAALYDDYTISLEKRPALVLDRLLVALQQALQEQRVSAHSVMADNDGPKFAPLRQLPLYSSDMSSLQRRGQAGPSRGRVLRCYFNAITCF